MPATPAAADPASPDTAAEPDGATPAPVGRHLLIVAVVVLVAALVTWAASDGVRVRGGLPIVVWQVLAAFAIQWVMFLHSWRARTERFYDLTGSLTYIVVTLGGLALCPARPARAWLLAAMVCVWAVRLGSFLFVRVRKAGDSRFEKILTQPTRLLVTWTMQGLWVSLTAMAAWIGVGTATPRHLGILSWIGVVVWIAGLALEATADAQKRAFRADPAHQGRFISTGVWAWSRHPNYVGEITLWVGVLLVAAPVFRGWQWIGVISPVFVTLLLTRVSGVPLLEKQADKRWGGQADYEQYKASTPVLIGWPKARSRS